MGLKNVGFQVIGCGLIIVIPVFEGVSMVAEKGGKKSVAAGDFDGDLAPSLPVGWRYEFQNFGARPMRAVRVRIMTAQI